MSDGTVLGTEVAKQDPPAETPEANVATTEPTKDASEKGGWLTSVPTKYREPLGNYKSQAEFIESALEAFDAKSKAIIRPDDSAGDEEWGAYWKAVGRPDTPDGYALKAPENVPINNELAKDFRKRAHEAGLNAEQSQSLFDWYVSSATELHKANSAFRQQERTQVETRLRDSFGADLETKMEGIRRMMHTFKGEGLYDYLETTGLGNNYDLVMFLNRVSEAISTDSFVSGEKPTVQDQKTKDAARYPSLEKKGWV